MLIKKKKIIILGTIFVTFLTGMVITSILVFNQKEKIENKEISQEEYANKLKNFSQKEITISATLGNITNNKVAILNKLKSLSNFPLAPSGLTLEVKENSTNLTLEGIAFTLLVKKQGKTDIEIRGFKVKRSQTDQEKYANKLKNFSQKEITISATSSDITTNKVDILNKLKSLSNFPLEPSGLTLEVKDDSAALTLEGIEFTLLVKKQGKTDIEIRGFKVKRSQTDQEKYANKLKNFSQKEITISATSGDITTNKVAILNKLKSLSNFPLEPSGLTLEVKDDSTALTLEGIAFTLLIKKQGKTNIEIRGFKIKRSQTNQEIAKNYWRKLIETYNFYSPEIHSPRRDFRLRFKRDNYNIKISATSGTLEDNKISIINEIKETYEFIIPPTGFDIKLQENQNQEITLEGVKVNIEIFKIGSSNISTLFENFFTVKRSQTTTEIENANYEKIRNYFQENQNKVVGIPKFKPPPNVSPNSLNQDQILSLVKRALWFDEPDIWTTNLLNKITLKQGQQINNFNQKRSIILEYGPNNDKKEVTLKLKKLSIKSTIANYFNKGETTSKSNKIITIPSKFTNLNSENAILRAIKNVLESKNPKFWKYLKNRLFVDRNNNELNSLSIGNTISSKSFKIHFRGNTRERQKRVTLLLRYLNAGEEINNYFSSVNERKIVIPATTSSLDSSKKILDAIKSYLKLKNSSIWTNELLNNLKISKNNETNSIVKGEFWKPFTIEYLRTKTIKESIIVKIKHSSI